MLTPVHDFPGDDISPEMYRHIVYNGYISSAATILGGAESYGLTIDTETFERWKRLGAAAGLVDDFLDDSPDMQHASVDYDEGLANAFEENDESLHAPAYADELLEPAVRLLRNSVLVMPRERIEPLIECASIIGSIVIKKTQCSDVDDYAEILKKEASYSSRLIHGTVSENVRSQANFPRFADWCDTAIELGTLVDCTLDLWSDYKQGRTAVRPTPLNGAKLLYRSYPAFKRMIGKRPELLAAYSAIRARTRFSKLPTVLLMK